MKLNANPASDETSLPRTKELRIEDAYMYLDQVKMEFADRPHVYNEFLDIMKMFKGQEIDIPGMMLRVSSLFRGNEPLLLGFSIFIPEGYRIEWMELNAAPSSDEAPLPLDLSVEFNDAVNYVTTIKRRFANDPKIYVEFLEVLHTYQKEQRGIKEVLDEVSVLFADHADLLSGFAYFLPDAVQGPAKARLDDAAWKAADRAREIQQRQAAAADDFCDFDCIVIDEDDFFDLKSEDFRSMDEVIDDVIDNEFDDDDGTLIEE